MSIVGGEETAVQFEPLLAKELLHHQCYPVVDEIDILVDLQGRLVSTAVGEVDVGLVNWHSLPDILEDLLDFGLDSEKGTRVCCLIS